MMYITVRSTDGGRETDDSLEILLVVKNSTFIYDETFDDAETVIAEAKDLAGELGIAFEPNEDVEALARPRNTAIVYLDQDQQEQLVLSDLHGKPLKIEVRWPSNQTQSQWFEEKFKEYKITHVFSILGHKDNIQGDLKDDLYPVDEWLEWARSVE